MEHHKRPAASGMHVVKRYTIDGNETVLDAYDIQGKSLGEVGAHCSRKRAWYAYLGKGKLGSPEGGLPSFDDRWSSSQQPLPHEHQR